MPDSSYPRLRVPCSSPADAIRFAAHLAGQGMDVDGVEDDTVLVPYGGSHAFVMDIATVAFEGGFAEDAAMAAMMLSHEAALIARGHAR